MIYKFSSTLIKLYFKLFYRLKVEGLENLPSGGALIAPNHVSFFEPPLICAALPEEVEFLARETLFAHPILGTLIRLLNAHPIKPGEGDLATFKLMAEMLTEGKKVVIFPEGKRSYNGRLLPLQSGAARLSLRTKTPIVPVRIQGAFEVWPRGRKWPRPFGKSTCTFLPPIYPEPFEALPKSEQARALTKALLGRLDGSAGDIP